MKKETCIFKALLRKCSYFFCENNFVWNDKLMNDFKEIPFSPILLIRTKLKYNNKPLTIL